MNGTSTFIDPPFQKAFETIKSRECILSNHRDALKVMLHDFDSNFDENHDPDRLNYEFQLKIIDSLTPSLPSRKRWETFCLEKNVIHQYREQKVHELSNRLHTLHELADNQVRGILSRSVSDKYFFYIRCWYVIRKLFLRAKLFRKFRKIVLLTLNPNSQPNFSLHHNYLQEAHTYYLSRRLRSCWLFFRSKFRCRLEVRLYSMQSEEKAYLHHILYYLRIWIDHWIRVRHCRSLLHRGEEGYQNRTTLKRKALSLLLSQVRRLSLLSLADSHYLSRLSSQCFSRLFSQSKRRGKLRDSLQSRFHLFFSIYLTKKTTTTTTTTTKKEGEGEREGEREAIFNLFFLSFTPLKFGWVKWKKQTKKRRERKEIEGSGKAVHYIRVMRRGLRGWRERVRVKKDRVFSLPFPFFPSSSSSYTTLPTSLLSPPPPPLSATSLSSLFYLRKFFLLFLSRLCHLLSYSRSLSHASLIYSYSRIHSSFHRFRNVIKQKKLHKEQQLQQKQQQLQQQQQIQKEKTREIKKNEKEQEKEEKEEKESENIEHDHDEKNFFQTENNNNKIKENNNNNNHNNHHHPHPPQDIFREEKNEWMKEKKKEKKKEKNRRNDDENNKKEKVQYPSENEKEKEKEQEKEKEKEKEKETSREKRHQYHPKFDQKIEKEELRVVNEEEEEEEEDEVEYELYLIEKEREKEFASHPISLSSHSFSSSPLSSSSPSLSSLSLSSVDQFSHSQEEEDDEEDVDDDNEENEERTMNGEEEDENWREEEEEKDTNRTHQSNLSLLYPPPSSSSSSSSSSHHPPPDPPHFSRLFHFIPQKAINIPLPTEEEEEEEEEEKEEKEEKEKIPFQQLPSISSSSFLQFSNTLQKIEQEKKEKENEMKKRNKLEEKNLNDPFNPHQQQQTREERGEEKIGEKKGGKRGEKRGEKKGEKSGEKIGEEEKKKEKEKEKEKRHQNSFLRERSTTTLPIISSTSSSLFSLPLSHIERALKIANNKNNNNNNNNPIKPTTQINTNQINTQDKKQQLPLPSSTSHLHPHPPHLPPPSILSSTQHSSHPPLERPHMTHNPPPLQSLSSPSISSISSTSISSIFSTSSLSIERKHNNNHHHPPHELDIEEEEEEEEEKEEKEEDDKEENNRQEEKENDGDEGGDGDEDLKDDQIDGEEEEEEDSISSSPSLSLLNSSLSLSSPSLPPLAEKGKKKNLMKKNHPPLPPTTTNTTTTPTTTATTTHRLPPVPPSSFSISRSIQASISISLSPSLISSPSSSSSSSSSSQFIQLPPPPPLPPPSNSSFSSSSPLPISSSSSSPSLSNWKKRQSFLSWRERIIIFKRKEKEIIKQTIDCRQKVFSLLFFTLLKQKIEKKQKLKQQNNFRGERRGGGGKEKEKREKVENTKNNKESNNRSTSSSTSSSSSSSSSSSFSSSSSLSSRFLIWIQSLLSLFIRFRSLSLSPSSLLIHSQKSQQRSIKIMKKYRSFRKWFHHLPPRFEFISTHSSSSSGSTPIIIHTGSTSPTPSTMLIADDYYSTFLIFKTIIKAFQNQINRKKQKKKGFQLFLQLYMNRWREKLRWRRKNMDSIIRSLQIAPLHCFHVWKTRWERKKKEKYSLLLASNHSQSFLSSSSSSPSQSSIIHSSSSSSLIRKKLTRGWIVLLDHWWTGKRYKKIFQIIQQSYQYLLKKDSFRSWTECHQSSLSLFLLASRSYQNRLKKQCVIQLKKRIFNKKKDLLIQRMKVIPFQLKRSLHRWLQHTHKQTQTRKSVSLKIKPLLPTIRTYNYTPSSFSSPSSSQNKDNHHHHHLNLTSHRLKHFASYTIQLALFSRVLLTRFFSQWREMREIRREESNRKKELVQGHRGTFQLRTIFDIWRRKRKSGKILSHSLERAEDLSIVLSLRSHLRYWRAFSFLSLRGRSNEMYMTITRPLFLSMKTWKASSSHSISTTQKISSHLSSVSRRKALRSLLFLHSFARTLRRGQYIVSKRTRSCFSRWNILRRKSCSLKVLGTALLTARHDLLVDALSLWRREARVKTAYTHKIEQLRKKQLSHSLFSFASNHLHRSLLKQHNQISQRFFRSRAGLRCFSRFSARIRSLWREEKAERISLARWTETAQSRAFSWLHRHGRVEKAVRLFYRFNGLSRGLNILMTLRGRKQQRSELDIFAARWLALSAVRKLWKRTLDPLGREEEERSRSREDLLRRVHKENMGQASLHWDDRLGRRGLKALSGAVLARIGSTQFISCCDDWRRARQLESGLRVLKRFTRRSRKRNIKVLTHIAFERRRALIQGLTGLELKWLGRRGRDRSWQVSGECFRSSALRRGLDMLRRFKFLRGYDPELVSFLFR